MARSASAPHRQEYCRPGAGGQHSIVARDTALAGFFLIVGTRTKSFMMQRDLRLDGRRSSIRMKVGEVGELSARYAPGQGEGFARLHLGGIDARGKKCRADQSKVGEPGNLGKRSRLPRFPGYRTASKRRFERKRVLHCSDGNVGVLRKNGEIADRLRSDCCSSSIRRMPSHLKLIVEKHSDGYVADPLGIGRGAILGQGDRYEGALADVRSAFAFHVQTFRGQSLAAAEDGPVLEALGVE